MAKVRSVVVAYQAKKNNQIQNGLDIVGAFDNLFQPIYPFPMSNLAIVVTFEELEGLGHFQCRLNAPDDDLITQGDFDVIPDPFGVGKKIMNLEKFLITKRGKYTMDIFEKIDDKLIFLKTCDLFIADYPPQRNFKEEEINAILANDTLIKTVKTEFRPYGAQRDVKVQVNLDKNAPIEDGYLSIPENDILVIDGLHHEMTGIRRQMEWLFGNPIPKKEEVN